ncbi:hypothetical protein [Priestia taiwanensis]|uniref:Uncharacterized protein n=1 Tax=Priestia taiwanensis TaxID=1347902 RepID=A0A917ARD7_9BACI|nr:hypothetical protein [Priestia taiwanensis]MBM7363227.1 TM2 domain-containing membrane protein YozV [Priestia taiwanensis]GGE68699.1 hypothetical protein GCM10007140_18460 [Priestia taiwanensis]
MNIQFLLSFSTILLLLFALFLVMKQLLQIAGHKPLDKKQLAFIILFLFQPLSVAIGMFTIQGIVSAKPFLEIVMNFGGITVIYCFFIWIWWSFLRKEES